MHGVRLMSLESNREKEKISAVAYAQEVLRREVHSQFLELICSNVSPEFQMVEDALCDFLNTEYTEQEMLDYLKAVNLEDKTKKESELFLNACSALIVASIVAPLLEECFIKARRLLLRRKLKAEHESVRDTLQTAKEILEQWKVTPRLCSFQQFSVEHAIELQALYSDLS